MCKYLFVDRYVSLSLPDHLPPSPYLFPFVSPYARFCSSHNGSSCSSAGKEPAVMNSEVPMVSPLNPSPQNDHECPCISYTPPPTETAIPCLVTQPVRMLTWRWPHATLLWKLFCAITRTLPANCRKSFHPELSQNRLRARSVSRILLVHGTRPNFLPCNDAKLFQLLSRLHV